MTLIPNSGRINGGANLYDRWHAGKRDILRIHICATRPGRRQLYDRICLERKLFVKMCWVGSCGGIIGPAGCVTKIPQVTGGIGGSIGNGNGCVNANSIGQSKRRNNRSWLGST